MKKYYFLIIAFWFFGFANGQIINFPDANFKAKLLAANSSIPIAKNLAGVYFKIDANDDGEIQDSEAINVSYVRVDNSNIISITGINNFVNIKYIYVFNNNITNIDLLNLTQLLILSCSGNQINNLTLNNLTNLQGLSCQNNQLTNLNLTAFSNLKTLWCNNNLITNLNISNLIYLDYAVADNNQLSFLDLSGLIKVTELGCGNNNISNLNLIDLVACKKLYVNNNNLINLNLTNQTILTELVCYDNQIISLDISKTKCNSLYCHNNNLIFLNLKNGVNETNLSFYSNPNLSYVCVDDSQLLDVQNEINLMGYSTTCQVNSYCSFNSGGIIYTIQGNNKLDNNNNGCEILDNIYPNMIYNFMGTAYSSNIISNNSGNYSIPVIAGTHTITPILQNPTYFNVSPTSATITFPATASPATQNFCITPNGNHQDLEVTLLPLNPARPGFDCRYKIIYKNKGNITMNGNVIFRFNDLVLDFVTATPTITSQIVNELSWDYINLLPFESREILVTLNLNSPTEIPAVNSGDILYFNSRILPIVGDENLNDNIANLNQTVVNSYDPNDKTCLEGNNIVPAKVGEYVHYMIRFENTGTFPAQNIVVKDMIDLAKFDIATLIPVSGSHDFYTRINDNKVEFIFENINLPFDNATNDGYVAFKIKTKSTLVLGNTFSNSANIYFDYNFPIVTNTATTTVANPLAVNDFEFASYFSLYPNPAKNILNLETKKDIKISSLSIYNVLGQLVQVITSPSKTIDVSDLKSGNYLVKIVTDNGSSSVRIIKE